MFLLIQFLLQLHFTTSTQIRYATVLERHIRGLALVRLLDSRRYMFCKSKALGRLENEQALINK